MSKIQINDVVRDMTAEEENQYNLDNQKNIEDNEKAILKNNKRNSGKQKLRDLGLDDDEIQALMGV